MWVSQICLCRTSIQTYILVCSSCRANFFVSVSSIACPLKINDLCIYFAYNGIFEGFGVPVGMENYKSAITDYTAKQYAVQAALLTNWLLTYTASSGSPSVISTRFYSNLIAMLLSNSWYSLMSSGLNFILILMWFIIFLKKELNTLCQIYFFHIRCFASHFCLDQLFKGRNCHSSNPTQVYNKLSWPCMVVLGASVVLCLICQPHTHIFCQPHTHLASYTSSNHTCPWAPMVLTEWWSSCSGLTVVGLYTQNVVKWQLLSLSL